MSSSDLLSPSLPASPFPTASLPALLQSFLVTHLGTGDCLRPGSCKSHSTAQHTAESKQILLCSPSRAPGWGAPQTAPSSCSRPGLKRKSIHGKSQAGICNPAMVPCSPLTCNPRPTETATVWLPNSFTALQPCELMGIELTAFQITVGLTSLIQLLEAT